jgi:hypothetical protein
LNGMPCAADRGGTSGEDLRLVVDFHVSERTAFGGSFREVALTTYVFSIQS